MDKRKNSENLKYIDQKLPFVENLKNYAYILWLAQFHWQTLYCSRVSLQGSKIESQWLSGELKWFLGESP